MACAICATRKPRRYCPGVHGDICTTCCGEGREETISCPLDCEYLEQARKHEKPVLVEPNLLPNRDIRVTQELLEENEGLLTAMAGALIRTALATEGAVDYDLREALEALVRTYRTLATGIYYEALPTNPLAAAFYAALVDSIDTFRKQESEAMGIHRVRDTTVMALLVFLQHYELDRNNGRKRGRAFLDVLREFEEPQEEDHDSDSPLILL